MKMRKVTEGAEEVRFCFGLYLLLLIFKLSHSSIITEGTTVVKEVIGR